jgi:hypothetical protein
MTRAPSEIVPSMPARRAYSAANSASVARARAAWSATYCSCGRTAKVRRGSTECVQSVRWAHRLQSAVENLILITWFLRLSTAGSHSMLSLPAGQIALLLSQSTAPSRPRSHWRRSPSPPGLPAPISLRRAEEVHPEVAPARDQEFRIHVAGVDHVHARQQVLGIQGTMHGLEHRAVGRGRGGGLHLRAGGGAGRRHTSRSGAPCSRSRTWCTCGRSAPPHHTGS